ncbi:MAG TPA: glucose-6-phosphate dehydrogenase, partial [Candidatus Sulfotelmatobacter sp.]
METVVPKQALELEMAGKAAGPCVFVLFGAAGDLTKRKLVPALFNLVRAKLLPNDFALMGVSVDDLSLDAFRDQVSQFLPSDDMESRKWLRDRLFYERGDFADSSLFSRLRQRLAQVDLEFHTQGNYLFYLAVAPKFFGAVVQQLGTAGLTQQHDGQWRRVVIEKPFGQDLESAKALNRSISTVL